VTDLEVARDLRAAAEYLRTHGWIQGHPFARPGADTPACMGGAIIQIGGRETCRQYADALGFGREEPRSCVAFWGSMPVWNDTPGRTLDEVLDRLESAALALEVRALAAAQPAEPAREEVAVA
jgi:hypothetical protein